MEPQVNTIAAVATPPGQGALGIIRLSGPDSFSIADSIWKGKRLSRSVTHTVHLGEIIDERGNTLDQGVATIFRAPNSFTGEDSVEFTLHGSPWILREVMHLLLRKGASGAEPGEFTRRAYLNGRMDLASAEGVADLIASSSKAAHRLAMEQTRGAFSKEFNTLRDSLVELASFLELELDFSEEDVEFADRTRLKEIASALLAKISHLVGSYSSGRAFKEGVPVVIAGVPNVGKSTLLNALLQEDKAIVSDIPGTTRDVIEDTCEIEGILFRFIDTAGLRTSDDKVESIGITRARERLAKASIILWLLDPTAPLTPQLAEMRESLEASEDVSATGDGKKVIPILTKSDLDPSAINLTASMSDAIDMSQISVSSPLRISAVEDTGLDTLKETLHTAAVSDYNPDSELLLTNARHYADLLQARDALRRAVAQMDAGSSADFIAMDIREAISSLTSLTGSITTPDLLNSIFSNFCIGK